MKIIVFTDLDGTFLDHHSYHYHDALPAVERLHNVGARIIPVTSKTMAEIDALDLPFGDVAYIAENGMVTRRADGTLTIDQDYDALIDFIARLPSDLRQHINGFNDMTLAEVADYISMSEDKAALAKARQASEPFLWSGDAEQMSHLQNHAHDQGFSLTRGGRFYHLMGQGGKADAIQSLIPSDGVSIALGDGPNDAQMLACVQYGIRIPNDHGHTFEVVNPQGKISTAPLPGPKGWCAAINDLLNDLL